MLAIRCLCTMQGTKDAGHQWYTLLHGVFTSLNMKHSSTDHGVYSWHYTGDNTFHPLKSCSYHGLICIATDDILILAQHPVIFDRLHLQFNSMFK